MTWLGVPDAFLKKRRKGLWRLRLKTNWWRTLISQQVDVFIKASPREAAAVRGRIRMFMKESRDKHQVELKSAMPAVSASTAGCTYRAINVAADDTCVATRSLSIAFLVGLPHTIAPKSATVRICHALVRSVLRSATLHAARSTPLVVPLFATKSQQASSEARY